MVSLLTTPSIIYQIYPRSFNDSNGDGVGDIQGIIQKLDYLKDLGITAIWLSPMYPSPMVDFGYDVSDYCNIDPLFGTLTDFEELVTKSHSLEIKIIMDYIPNHTSSIHSWFQSSKKSKDNAKRDWYIWADAKPDGSPPNNWLGYFGGSAWEWDEETKQYYYHAFAKEQPDLNWRNPEVAEAMYGVLKFWLKKGVDGFRVDAISHLLEDENLVDEPSNSHYHQGKDSPFRSLTHSSTVNFKGNSSVVKGMVEVVKNNGGTIFVTESPSGANLEDMYELYNEVSWENFMSFNFAYIKLNYDALSFKNFIDTYDEKLGPTMVPNTVLGNHDRHRIATRVGIDQARISHMLLLTLRGVPFIYYGDEIGMTDTTILDHLIVDPYELNTPGKDLGRDPERTPMQWNSDKHSGFSAGESTWLPINENYKEVNVEKEKEDSKSFLTLVKELIKLKTLLPALSNGAYYPLPIPANNTLLFLRRFEGSKILVLLNFDDKDKEITLDYPDTKVLLSASLNIEKETKLNLTNFFLKGNEGLILEI